MISEVAAVLVILCATDWEPLVFGDTAGYIMLGRKLVEGAGSAWSGGQGRSGRS